MPDVVTGKPEPRERVIVALDFDSADAARRCIAGLDGVVGAFKVGLQLFTAAGPKFVRELTAAGRRIFLDLKFHDIPNTVAMASVEAARLGVWMFNLHAAGGPVMMRRAAEAVAELSLRSNLETPKVIAVTVLTSESAGGGTDVAGKVLELSCQANEAGLDGVVASALEAKAIRTNVSGPGFLIVTPGIRPDFATNDDQKRVMTPAGAIRAGSDYLVIGRPITAADDPAKAALRIIEEMAAACDPFQIGQTT